MPEKRKNRSAHLFCYQLITLMTLMTVSVHRSCSGGDVSEVCLLFPPHIPFLPLDKVYFSPKFKKTLTARIMMEEQVLTQLAKETNWRNHAL